MGGGVRGKEGVWAVTVVCFDAEKGGGADVDPEAEADLHWSRNVLSARPLSRMWVSRSLPRLALPCPALRLPRAVQCSVGLRTASRFRALNFDVVWFDESFLCVVIVGSLAGPLEYVDLLAAKGNIFLILGRLMHAGHSSDELFEQLLVCRM